MSIELTLAEFEGEVAQCERLIENAHGLAPDGSNILPEIDRQQITIAAFLNMFKAWEGFLESAIEKFMTGEATSNGIIPVRYANPKDIDAAKRMIRGVKAYFDYANHENVKQIVRIYFQDGYPIGPNIDAINSDLADLRIMRNSCAHISSSTQLSLDGLAVRLFGKPSAGIGLYQLLTSTHPQSQPADTVFGTYRSKLLVTAELISRG